MFTAGGHVAGDASPRPPPVVAEDPASAGAGAEGVTENPFPLNSRRLTGPYVKFIANEIELLRARVAELEAHARTSSVWS